MTTYNLRSSVLGGQVVADITSSGTRRVGYVYVNGQLIARQYQFSGVQWEHRDPMNTRARHTSSTGANLGGAEYDPTHSSVGLEDPGPAPGGDGTLPDLLYPKGGDPTDLSGGCMLDFMVVPCSVAMSVVNMEAGVETDPYQTPGLQWNPNLNGGRGAFEVFHAKADGFVGYGEIGTRYAGNGVFRKQPVLLRHARNRSRSAGNSGVANADLGEDGEQSSGLFREGPLWNNYFPTKQPGLQGRFTYVVQQLLENEDCVNWFAARTKELGHPATLPDVVKRTGFNFYFLGDSASLTGLEGLNTSRFGNRAGFGQTLFGGSANPQVVMNRSYFNNNNNDKIAQEVIHEMFHGAGLHRGSAPKSGGFFRPNDLYPEVQYDDSNGIWGHCAKGVK